MKVLSLGRNLVKSLQGIEVGILHLKVVSLQQRNPGSSRDFGAIVDFLQPGETKNLKILEIVQFFEI